MACDWPAGQAVHLAEFAPEKLPDAQFEQEVLPVLPWNFPAPQLRQVVESVPLW